MRKIFLLLTCLGFVLSIRAQQVRPESSAKIYDEIAQLKHLVNVLYVAAHPDDENTRLLAWLVNEKNVRTGYLSLTRGDGGQNILGSEQGEALGLIRTHELLEARKIDGAEQYFTSAVDFGFSKTGTETFKHWYRDDIVFDAAFVMRRFRPDVVICRFPPDSRAGHGQHTASAIIGADAYKMANDGNYVITSYISKNYKGKALPTTTDLNKPCESKRLLFNAFRFGSFNTTNESMFKVKVGQYMPGFGLGAGELAGMSRSVHKSQGAGTPNVPGEQYEYFQLLQGDTMTKSLFDGIDMTWGRVGRKDIGEDIQAVLDNFDFKHPDASLPALLEIRKKIATVKDDYWRNEKMDELDKLILHCSGLLAEVVAKQPQAVAGATLSFKLNIIARSAIPVRLKNINWLNSDSAANLKMTSDSLYSFEHNITIPANTPITQPYWLSEPSSDPSVYNIPNDSLIGLAETPNNLNAVLKLKIGDEYVDVKVPLSYKKLDPVKGDVVEQLRIVPDVTLEFATKALIVDASGKVTAYVNIHANKSVAGMLGISDEVGNAKLLASIDNLSLREGEDTTVSFTINAADRKNLVAFMKTNTGYNNLTQHLIQYSHIPTLQYFTPAQVKVIKKDWKCTVKKIGYIEGAGDYTATFLRNAGLQVDILKASELNDANKLKQYEAIVTGVRAVNVEKRMAYWMPTLLKYVENGGTLVMQYNNLQDMSTTHLGPYPFTLANERVTEEDAKVKFTHPEHKLLNYPNKITDKDFDNWVQERGLYFATKWDDKYTTLFEMNDTGEKPLLGSTLYTKYGKGNYIYTSLAFFRELPAGNAGAIRLLVNMLSVGK